MRRITLWALITATIFVLLFSYHTSTDSGTVTTAVTPLEAPAVATASATPDPTAAAAPPASAATESAGTQTFTGASADTRWGPVQVQITVASGKITAATAVVYPQENRRDLQINADAIPTLQQETVAAQSANIDMVSGATVTSDGYVQSLQSAIDQAQLR